MYLQKIQNIIIGYVNITIEGYYIEKFINSCRVNGIYLGNIKREKSTIIHTSVPVKEYKRVAKISKKNKCKIRIDKKRGLPFFIHKYRKRKIFAISLIILVCALTILSKFVWNIEINGNTTVSSNDILEIAKSEGLEVGKFKGKINAKQIVEKIRMERSDISWVGIKINGTNVSIEIVEADAIPKIIDKNDYCNIVAKNDAMIVSAEAQNGTLKVKEGDVVKKGDILVGGWLEGKYTGTRYVHADGKVMAKVWHSKKEKIYYKQTIKNETGKKEKKYSVDINNFEINLYKRLSKFEIYDTISTEKKLKISSNFYLPFKLIVKENYEVKNNEKNYTKEEAKNIGIDKISNELKVEIANSGDIVNEYINTNESDEYIEIEVIYEVLENIGTEEKIAL